MLTPVWISTGLMSRSVLPSSLCIRSPPGSTLDVDLFEPPERPSEKTRTDLAEPLRRVGDEEVILDLARRPLVQEPLFRQPRAHDRGGGPRRIDQRDPRADHPADDPFEQRVVRAPEHQRVDPLALQLLEVRSEERRVGN